MIESFLDSLNIPDNCKIGKRLTKKQFKENFSLKANEKKILTDNIDNITLEYFLSKNTINILPYIDEEKDYSEVAFVRVDISNRNKVKQIADIIQNIPHLLIVIFSFENSICINISPKRINKADSNKLVVEENYFTKWIDLDSIDALEKEFISKLDIHNQSFTDFFSFYNSYLDKIIAFNASEYSGNIRATEETKEILDEISKIETKISELRNKIKKETSFSDKVNMNIELKKSNDRLKELQGSL